MLLSTDDHAGDIWIIITANLLSWLMFLDYLSNR